MATISDENEVKMIEDLALDAEISMEKDDARKDLKEKRGIMKQTFYSGPHKMKHMIPKGRHL
ncbi:MAG: hypothetical protein M0T70_13400 [Geobacteraceae bacterium]|nr:hypothetical protein [Geobacteraceae bacterium]